uniref:Uncharacterized protein n=1 Tax=Anguilla anguilla TaxID=7936 RepID=A0A0E9T1W8_ANGAN
MSLCFMREFSLTIPYDISPSNVTAHPQVLAGGKNPT